jgi:hypothetical protein
MGGTCNTRGSNCKCKQYLLMKSQMKKPRMWHTGVHKFRALGRPGG